MPRKRARSLPQHDIHTVVGMQWGGIKNGALLELIEREGLNVFLTGDKNMEYQQRLEGRGQVKSRGSIVACSLNTRNPQATKTQVLVALHMACPTASRGAAHRSRVRDAGSPSR